MAAMVLYITASAQITLSGSNREYRQSTKHSNTVIVANKNRGDVSRWHVNFGLQSAFGGCDSNRKKFSMAMGGEIGTHYEFPFGLALGASIALDIVDFDYPEMRILPIIGWYFLPEKKGNPFITISPGFATAFESHEIGWFGFDVKVGYRHMFTKNLGLSVSTGCAGSIDWWGIPLNVGLVFRPSINR